MEAFKNIFDEKFIRKFANKIKKYSSSFEEELYINEVLKTLFDLELKDRMRLISKTLNTYLLCEYKEVIVILQQLKKDFNKEELISLQSMILPDYVEVFGLDNFDLSMKALEYFTIDSSSEFAVRHFLIKDEKKALEYFYKWSKSSNEHIRRLSSEGSRPRLPWAIALSSFKKDPSLILPILEELKNDDSLYVRRSVANNLNDIAKDNPTFVIDFIKNNIGNNKNSDWLLKHGARTLLKKGNKQTLELFGFKEIPNVNIEDFKIDTFVKVNENLNFSFSIISSEIMGLLRVEYEIDFMMSNNKRSKKIFMISSSKVKSTSKIVVKKHSFKKITTRKYYKGIHYLSIIINGVKTLSKSFILK